MKFILKDGSIIDVKAGSATLGKRANEVIIGADDVKFLSTEKGIDWFYKSVLTRLPPRLYA